MKNNKKGCSILQGFASVIALIIAVRDFIQGRISDGVLWLIIAGIWLFVLIRDSKKGVSK